MTLGYLGLDYDLLVSGHASLNKERQQGQRTWYHRPVISYIIDHPQGKTLFETGVAPSFKDE